MWLAHVAAVASLLTLLIAGLAHLADLGGFARQLRDQGVWWDPVVPVVAIGVPIAEVALGATGTGALLAGAVAVLRPTLLFATALFGAYAAFLMWLRHYRRGAPCGCSTGGVPATAWTVVRADVFVAMSAFAYFAVGPAGLPAVETISTVAAALPLALLLWLLPEALVIPRDRFGGGMVNTS